MPQTVTKTYSLYQYSELSDSAKQKALEWWRSCEDSFWSEQAIEDFHQICATFGLEIGNVYFSGFWSQGDGACFVGEYNYKAQGLKALKEYAPNETILHTLVQRLQNEQRKYFYRLRVTTTHRGHYYHSGCMPVEIYKTSDYYRDEQIEHDDIEQIMREIADYLYKKLEKAYDFEISAENFADACESNEYTFDINGNRTD